jgi:putative hydrolase
VSNLPDRHDDEDPFAGLPPELRAMLEQLGGPEGLAAAQEQIAGMLGGLGGPGGLGAMFGAGGTPPTGPVDWSLATRVALQVAAEGDRSPTDAERERAEQAIALAEHWLDATPLPAPPDAGQLVVDSRQAWVNAAIPALRPLVEPVARAATDALIDLARDQFGALGEEVAERGELPPIPGLEALPPGFADLIGQLIGGDPADLLRPAGAAVAGLQAGQVIGQLARQLFGAYDLGIPTAPRAQAHHLAVNVDEAFAGYDLDATEVAVVLALGEAAHRRLYHAVPWLEAHVASLVARFAAGTTVDEQRLRELSDELLLGVDADDPDALRAAMERAASLQLEPTAEQRRVLERLQGVVCLVGAWARHEVARAVEGRLPSLPRIDEVLRRRRATRGDGEELLAGLLGLDLKPADEAIGERFVAAVEESLGPAGLRRALAHPENLPDAEELAEPSRWLVRTADDLDVPDDAAALFEGLDDGDAPHEGTAEERRREHDDD